MYQIAVCDDDRADLSRTVRLTRRILDEAGVPCCVDSYGDGRPLLSEIQRGRRFDLLLLDVRMAGLDGMALAAELKDRPARPDVVFADDADEARHTLHRLAKEDYAVIYVTEQLAQRISADVDRYKDAVTPAVILIPGKSGSLGLGQAALQSAVERAVGADIS